jgi:hypothetical protein
MWMCVSAASDLFARSEAKDLPAYLADCQFAGDRRPCAASRKKRNRSTPAFCFSGSWIGR